MQWRGKFIITPKGKGCASSHRFLLSLAFLSVIRRSAGQVKYESRCWICISIVFVLCVAEQEEQCQSPQNDIQQNAVHMFLTKPMESVRNRLTWHEATVSSSEIYVCSTPPCSWSGFCKTTSERRSVLIWQPFGLSHMLIMNLLSSVNVCCWIWHIQT